MTDVKNKEMYLKEVIYNTSNVLFDASHMLSDIEAEVMKSKWENFDASVLQSIDFLNQTLENVGYFLEAISTYSACAARINISMASDRILLEDIKSKICGGTISNINEKGSADFF